VPVDLLYQKYILYNLTSERKFCNYQVHLIIILVTKTLWWIIQ